MLISAYLASIVMHLVFSGLFSLNLSSPLKPDDHVEQRYEIKYFTVRKIGVRCTARERT
jgi:hypothetical protein